jgi:hypothetical protein
MSHVLAIWRMVQIRNEYYHTRISNKSILNGEKYLLKYMLQPITNILIKKRVIITANLFKESNTN